MEEDFKRHIAHESRKSKKLSGTALPAQASVANANSGDRLGSTFTPKSPFDRCLALQAKPGRVRQPWTPVPRTPFFQPASCANWGIPPSARRSYEMADGTEQELPIGFGVIELEGLAAGATLVFGGEEQEPLLGVTVLESIGLWIDPKHERLVRRLPKLKGSSEKKSDKYVAGSSGRTSATN